MYELSYTKNVAIYALNYRRSFAKRAVFSDDEKPKSYVPAIFDRTYMYRVAD